MTKRENYLLIAMSILVGILIFNLVMNQSKTDSNYCDPTDHDFRVVTIHDPDSLAKTFIGMVYIKSPDEKMYDIPLTFEARLADYVCEKCGMKILVRIPFSQDVDFKGLYGGK